MGLTLDTSTVAFEDLRQLDHLALTLTGQQHANLMVGRRSCAKLKLRTIRARQDLKNTLRRAFDDINYRLQKIIIPSQARRHPPSLRRCQPSSRWSSQELSIAQSGSGGCSGKPSTSSRRPWRKGSGFGV